MKFYVVRHCSTRYSEEKIYCGNTDAPLSEAGLKEAERLTETAKGYHIDLVLASPLMRARDTARAIVGNRDIPILYDERLKERNFGDFEGKSVERPEGKVFRYSFALKYPSGESNLQIAARVYGLLDEIKDRYAGKSVVIVSHGSVCRLIRTYFMDMTDEEFYQYSHRNGTIEEYETS